MIKNDHYYQLLTDREKVSYKLFICAINQRFLLIGTGLLKEEGSIRKVVEAINRDHPELYYVNLFRWPNACWFRMFPDQMFLSEAAIRKDGYEF